MTTTIINNKSNFVINIDLLQPEYKSLHPDNLPFFSITEKRRYCDIYPDGLFPGSTIDKDNTNNQVSQVLCFFNYLEWSRITADDVEEPSGDGNYYLTTTFFDMRNKGWKSIEPIEKPGDTIGYCFNGVDYHTNNPEVRRTVYSVIYKNIIKSLPVHRKLKEYMNQASIKITGADVEVLKVLAESLVD
jgi:hypothetical protein